MLYKVLEAIEKRLDAVEGKISFSNASNLSSPQLELVQNEDRFNTVRDALKSMHKLDLDKLICTVCVIVFPWICR